MLNISEPQVQRAIQRLKSGKAAGVDGVIAETVSYTHLRAHET